MASLRWSAAAESTRIALLVLILLVVAIGLSLERGDPRILLAKGVIVSGAAGMYVLGMLFAEHSFVRSAALRR